MVDKKTQFTASVQIPTKKTLDDYAEEHNLNRSQALTEVVNQWEEVTESGDYRPMELEVEPADAVPGKTTPAADTTAASRENAATLLNTGGTTTALGSAMLLSWWVVNVPAAPAALVATAGVPIALLGLLNVVAGAWGTIDATREWLGWGDNQQTQSPDEEVSEA